MMDGDPDRDVRERMTAALEAHPGYRLAEEDPDFLESEMARPARVALELMRPEGALREQRINSTVVVWGSARIVSPAEARRGLAEAQAAAAARPGDTQAVALQAEALRRLKYSRYYDEARALARALATAGAGADCRDYVVITGGGPGIMEAANRGAWESGAVSIGLNIDLPSEQRPNPFITPGLAFRFHYFALRKMHFMLRACALVAFPGGFGTMDELFEALTLVQTRRIRRIPLVLVGRDYWSRVIDFRFLVEEGFVDAADLGLFELVETGAEAADAIRRYYTAPPGA